MEWYAQLHEEKRQKYQDKFASNEKFRNQELEYILILNLAQK